VDDEIVSSRLLELMDDILGGKAPNAGRFCASCYHPLGREREVCPHCGLATSRRAPVEAIPLAILALHRRRRGREGLVVRTMAWAGLTIGVIVALLPLAFFDVRWWTLVSFFGLLFLFYLASANLANSVGDALGYRWGRRLFERGWAELGEERGTRDAGASKQ
jgi:hypothetical protein